MLETITHSNEALFKSYGAIARNSIGRGGVATSSEKVNCSLGSAQLVLCNAELLSFGVGNDHLTKSNCVLQSSVWLSINVVGQNPRLQHRVLLEIFVANVLRDLKVAITIVVEGDSGLGVGNSLTDEDS